MSLVEINLCSVLMRDEFGDVVAKVFRLILNKGALPTGIIAQETGLRPSEVKRALRVLVHHNLATFEVHKRGFVEYSALLQNALARPRFPQYIYAAKTLYGNAAELIVEALLQNGQMLMTEVLHKVHERLNEALTEAGQKPMTVYQLRDTFKDLAQTMFIKRCPNIEEADASVAPKFCTDEDASLYELPDVKLGDSKKRKLSTSESEQPRKKVRIDESNDDGIYWKVNFERFDRHLRDQMLVVALSRKIDVKAGEIFRTVLRLSEMTSDVRAPQTNPLSCTEIFQGLPKELGLSRQITDHYLKIMVEDKVEFIQKVGESGGGMFCVNFQKAFTNLAKAHIESVVQERFGSKSLRIYKLIMAKRHLEQKQIEEFAMVPAKEAKELVYQMFEEHFLAVTEVPKTPDHVPSRTYFLFSVNVNQVSRMLLQRCYKTLYNLILKRNQELSENRRLLDKQARMEAIVASLEQSGADDSQKAEIEDMITPGEKSHLTKVTRRTKMLSKGELQMDDTILVLQLYILYAHSK